MMSQPQRREQYAECSDDSKADRPRQRDKKAAHQNRADEEVEKAPKHIDDRRGLANPPWRGEWRLEFGAANALDEMWYAVGEECPGKEMHEIVVPRHHSSPLCSTHMFEAQ